MRLPLTEFWNTKATWDGKCRRCKKCLYGWMKEYVKKNRDKVRFLKRRSDKKCKDEIALRKAKRYEQNKGAVKAKDYQLRLEVLSRYCGGEPKCQCPGCDVKFPQFLEFDHIEGGGRKHAIANKYVGGGRLMLHWMIRNNYPSGFQVLCSNCNHAKRNKNSCPLSGQKHW